MELTELQALERALPDADLQAGAGRVRARRGRAALGLRGQGVPRLPRRDLGLLGRPLPPGRGRGGARAGRSADARLQPLLHRADGAARRAALASRASAAASSSATRGPRRTSARSRSPASTPTGAGSRRRRSSASSGDFHGRTYGALSATPKLAENEALGPMLPGFRSVPFNDAEALRDAVGEDTAAVLIEPIQGEAGVYPVSDEALLAAREACDEAGALLILDEIQTGIGRTGSLWAYEQTPVRPDVITSAKALGGGMPIGACVTAPEAGEVLEPGDHGSTFAGGAGRHRRGAGRARHRSTIRRCCARCASWARRCARACRRSTGVREVARSRPDARGRARARGSTPPRSAPTCCERGLIVNVPEPGTLRLLPPLTVDSAQIDARRCADRRIAPKLRSAMSAREQHQRAAVLAPRRTRAAARLAEIVEAAEQAAHEGDRRRRGGGAPQARRGRTSGPTGSSPNGCARWPTRSTRRSPGRRPPSGTSNRSSR